MFIRQVGLGSLGQTSNNEHETRTIIFHYISETVHLNTTCIISLMCWFCWVDALKPLFLSVHGLASQETLSASMGNGHPNSGLGLSG